MFVTVSSSEGKEGQLAFLPFFVLVWFFLTIRQYQETILSTPGLTQRQQRVQQFLAPVVVFTGG